MTPLPIRIFLMVDFLARTAGKYRFRPVAHQFSPSAVFPAEPVALSTLRLPIGAEWHAWSFVHNNRK
jgi:hypothetical protein